MNWRHCGNNAATVESPATRRSRDNCGHIGLLSGARLSQNSENQQVKTATMILLEKCGLAIIT